MMWDDLIDWFMDYGCLPAIGIFAVVMSCLIVYGCSQDQKAYKEFMRQCMQDHKEYECLAMWRAGERNTQVIPMPIVVPVR